MESTRKERSVSPPMAPVEYAGEWVAWDKDRRQIVAHGRDVVAVHQTAIAAGHAGAILQRVRKPGVAFIGQL